MDTLSPEQRAAVQAVLNGRNIFITGPGGTGKSFLLDVLVKELKRAGKRVTVTAMTGCAALLLNLQAKTLHAWAGIGLGRGSLQSLITGISQHFPRKKRWLSTQVLIVDEISMLTPGLLETLDKIGRFIRNKPNVPMGGLQVVFVGDFYQLPPVARDKPDALFAFQSPVWQQLIHETHELKTIFRQRDPVFQAVLEEARRGTLSPESLAVLEGRRNTAWRGQLIRPTLLFTRNADVDSINQRQFDKLPGSPVVFKARTILTAGKKEADYADAIAKMDKDAPYVPELILKEGAQVMLLTNLDFEAGLVNGSRGVVKGFSSAGYPQVLFKTTTVAIEIKSATWESDTDPAFTREQIPLRLAYALTIHKAQGASLDAALVDVGPATFEFGQAYVALSRVRSLEGLWVHDLDARAFRIHPAVEDFYAGLAAPAPTSAQAQEPELDFLDDN
jgi:ATP-dependent DNA helicase PIF1